MIKRGVMKSIVWALFVAVLLGVAIVVGSRNLWRHAVERIPLTYDPQYWSLVFPSGMYTVATLMFANATGMLFLLIIPRIFVYIAMLVWLITFSAIILKIAIFCFCIWTAKASPATKAHWLSLHHFFFFFFFFFFSGRTITVYPFCPDGLS